MWNKIKKFFKDSETIFLARLEAAVGLIVSIVGVLDWSPLLSVGMDTGFTWRQVLLLGSIMLIKGIITEIARRRRDNTL